MEKFEEHPQENPHSDIQPTTPTRRKTMMLQNIQGIMASKIWRKILKNQGYRGHIIIDTDNRPNKMRYGGGFFVLLVFFDKSVSDKTLKKYWKEGACLPKCVGSESLDHVEPYHFYGTMRMIQYS